MPRFLEKKLRAEASNKGFKGKRADRYVYGVMNNMGAMRGNRETVKGARMEAKHEADQQSPHRKRMREEISKYKGESHSFDHRRPKRKVLSRYHR